VEEEPIGPSRRSRLIKPLAPRSHAETPTKTGPINPENHADSPRFTARLTPKNDRAEIPECFHPEIPARFDFSLTSINMCDHYLRGSPIPRTGEKRSMNHADWISTFVGLAESAFASSIRSTPFSSVAFIPSRSTAEESLIERSNPPKYRLL
jgi:hypothetical protein